MLVIYPAFLDFQEIIIILVVAVVIFGPDKIPEIARGLGQAVRKMKEATEDIKQEILNPAENLDPTKEIRETIADLDPTKDIKNSLFGTDSTQDLSKVLENPINDFEKALTDSMSDKEPIKEVVNVAKVEPVVEVEKTEIEVKTEDELGSGGSISR